MKWLSEQTGVSASMLSDYGRGKMPGADKAVAIAETLGVDLNWLLTGRGPPPTQSAVADRQLDYHAPRQENSADQVGIAVSDVAYGLGGAFVDDDSATTTVERFPRAFIRQFTQGPFSRLYFATGIGDSMEPTIHHSDLVLIDRSQEMLRVSDQLWALHAGQIAMIKRVRVMPDGAVLLVSDNPDVSDYRLGENELQLIGRVVAVVKRV
jgi:phage repressor protein C with HTH and peptisase S24 domain